MSNLLSQSLEHDDAVQMARRGDRREESRTRVIKGSLIRQDNGGSYSDRQGSQSSN